MSGEGVKPPGPFFETIRWQGITRGVGFRAMACPTTRGEVPASAAISP
jgi:hypothetical protein